MQFAKYRLSLVMEESSKDIYESTVANPGEIGRIAVNELHLCESPSENLAVVALDVKNKPIGASIVSRGGINSTLAEPRFVFAFLMSVNAAGA